VGRRIAAAAALLLAFSLGGDVSGQAQPVSTASLPVLTPEPFDHPAAPPKRLVPGTLLARVAQGRVVTVRNAPGGAVVTRLGATTEFGSPRTFAATPAGHGLRVITTELPNGRTGWVDGRGALRLSRTSVALDVDLSSRLLRVRAGKRLLRTLRVGIGAPGTATPTGRFAITDKLRGSDYSAVYGCCILALSGHQTNLPPGWTGGDRLAIHGGSTGGAVSTGCLHAAETDLHWLMRSVPLGAQITIHP
jgi:hypothetical protein